MLSAGVLVLLTVLTMSANRMLLESSQTSFESEAVSTAADLANILLAEIGRPEKQFDASVTYSYYQSSGEFTIASSFGPNASESFALPDTSTPFKSIVRYSDVDDYHNYQRIANGPTINGFLLSVKVFYVTSINPDATSSSRTYSKKVEVTVTHSLYLPNGIKIYGVFRY